MRSRPGWWWSQCSATQYNQGGGRSKGGPGRLAAAPTLRVLRSQQEPQMWRWGRKQLKEQDQEEEKRHLEQPPLIWEVLLSQGSGLWKKDHC